MKKTEVISNINVFLHYKPLNADEYHIPSFKEDPHMGFGNEDEHVTDIS